MESYLSQDLLGYPMAWWGPSGPRLMKSHPSWGFLYGVLSRSAIGLRLSARRAVPKPSSKVSGLWNEQKKTRPGALSGLALYEHVVCSSCAFTDWSLRFDPSCIYSVYTLYILRFDPSCGDPAMCCLHQDPVV